MPFLQRTYRFLANRLRQVSLMSTTGRRALRYGTSAGRRRRTKSLFKDSFEQALTNRFAQYVFDTGQVRFFLQSPWPFIAINEDGSRSNSAVNFFKKPGALAVRNFSVDDAGIEKGMLQHWFGVVAVEAMNDLVALWIERGAHGFRQFRVTRKYQYRLHSNAVDYGFRRPNE